jgi:hypothetical protein
MPDGITFLLTVLLLFSTSSGAIFLAAFLGSLNHGMMILIAPLLLLLRKLADERIAWRSLTVALAGLAAGRGVVWGFFELSQVEIQSRLDFIVGQGLGFWAELAGRQHPLAGLTLHGAFWFGAVVCGLSAVRHNRRYAAAFLSGLALCWGITIVMLDNTRVFSLLAWAPSFHCLLYAQRHPGDSAVSGRHSAEMRRVLLVVALLGLLSPRYYLWSGNVVATPFYSFYGSILRWIVEMAG